MMSLRLSQDTLKEVYDEEIRRASADDIFREMKKLPFSG